ncbi:uncharacterized protein V1510DRAFT_369734 [Dipodascopsis tothii]|uniref:uncharacterized protein n=1 Tax=Dipodascopsis tothii TaxID=44089 RepID=UPI0034CE5CEC
MFSGKTTFLEFYDSSSAYGAAATFFVTLMVSVFVVDEVTDEYSQVDRLWSLLPPLTTLHYVIHTYRQTGIHSHRLTIALTLHAFWSVRLTWNFVRKGGYSGVEDYRWRVLKEWIPNKVLWRLFDLIFIAVIQLVLLLNITAPNAVFAEYATVPMRLWEYGFVAAIVGWIMLESAADEYMWAYQQAKNFYKLLRKAPRGFTPQQLDRGFCTIGVFAYSRHANFLAEQMIWVTLYLWGWALVVAEQGFVWAHWTIIGAIGYVLLFQGSTTFTEMITAGKYPEYAAYQAVVGRFLPWRVWTEPAGTEGPGDGPTAGPGETAKDK